MLGSTEMYKGDIVPTLEVWAQGPLEPVLMGSAVRGWKKGRVQGKGPSHLAAAMFSYCY
jgi:hypothetical protein